MDVASGQMMRVSSAVDVGQGLTVSGERGVVTASITAVVFDIDAALVLTRAIHGVPRQLTVILYIYTHHTVHSVPSSRMYTVLERNILATHT